MKPQNFIVDGKFLKMIENKTKTAAWFVSNCNDSPSNRQELVKQLQKFIKVDIYGKCGLPCPKRPKQCVNLDHYWFYFSFENSLCADYVTEKVYSRIYQKAVVVVFNGADMNNFLPPHSYIDANSFKTPQELAEHLIYLMNHPEEYVKYFWWRKHYLISTWARIDYDKICDALNSPQVGDGRSSYSNMTAWLHRSCDIETKIKF